MPYVRIVNRCIPKYDYGLKLNKITIVNMPDVLQIEVIYCPGEGSPLSRQLEVPAGCTTEQAVEQSGLLSSIPDQYQDELQVGIFGKQCSPQAVLQNLDRIEIYRPLLLSPTEARRLRAQTLANN